MEKKCEKEVIDLHTFFAQWFSSEVENNDEVFSRVENALDKQFVLIVPTGELQPREKILQQIKAGYGSRKDDEKEYRLWVQNIQCRLTEGNLCLVTYEEWAEVEGKTTARLSSALFRKNEKAVNGVEWVHVHEVYIPSE
ncbi:MAG: hypothetical protein ACTSPM_13675 [Candidatus Heimdallarchaeota archaeon]